MTSLNTVVPGMLTVGTYQGFAPVSFSSGRAAFGKDIQFLRAFAMRMGLSLDVRFFEFERIWERPARGEVDIAAAGIQPGEERHIPGVAWSRPYFSVQRSLVVRASEQSVLRSMADFAGRIIAVTRGSTADLDTEARKPETASIVYFEQQENAIEDLLAGRIDAFGTGDICGHYAVAQHPEWLAITDVHEMHQAEQFAFAMEEGSDLVEPINEFIERNGANYREISPICPWIDFQI